MVGCLLCALGGALLLASLVAFCLAAATWLRGRRARRARPSAPPSADDIPVFVGPPTRPHSPFGRGAATRRADPSTYPKGHLDP